MSHVPPELKYSQNHEWLRAEKDGSYTVGITEHAQSLLGDMIFIDLPGVDDHFMSGENCAVTESVKAASDIYAPISGTVIATNEALETMPELVNSDPYGEGWLFRITLDDETELSELLDATAYQSILDDEAE